MSASWLCDLLGNNYVQITVVALACILNTIALRRLEARTLRALLDQTELLHEAFIAIEYLQCSLRATTPGEREGLRMVAVAKVEMLERRKQLREQAKRSSWRDLFRRKKAPPPPWA